VSRPRDPVHLHTTEEHALALARYVAARAGELPEVLFWERLRTLHEAMCTQAGWPVRPWNPVATALSQLIGEERKLWLWVADGERPPKRLRFYSVPRIAAAVTPRQEPDGNVDPGADPGTGSPGAAARAVALCGRVAA
jgi:hypothetical protein